MIYRILSTVAPVVILLCVSCMKDDYTQFVETTARLKGKPDVSVVVVGDAISSSDFSETGSSYGTFLKPKLAEFLDTRISMINSSRPDETFSLAGKHIQEDVFSFRPDIVFVMLGMNDSNDPGLVIPVFKEVVSDYFSRLRGREILVIALTTTGYRDLQSGDEKFDRLREFNDKLAFQARLHHAPVIDIALHMEELRQNKPAEYLSMFADTVHLNDRGCEYLAEYIFQTIRKTVDKVK